MKGPKKPEPDEERLEATGRLADAVTDADPVDWSEERTETRGLKSLERIAQAFRTTARDWDAEHPHDPLAVPPPGDRHGATSEVAFRWGHLEALERLGAGSYGEVWRARDTRLDREVALKLRAGDGSRADDPGVRRFLDEARRLARVRHPGVLTVHGADLHDARVGLWADLVDGDTLEERLAKDGPLGADEAALVGRDLCRALAAIHAAGLLHGDVKTHNVMRERGGAIVLLDFGSGRALPGDAGDVSPDDDPTAPTGTPLASAPEVLRGSAPDARSDVYSLGVLLYRLVTGSYPVPARTFRELREKHDRGESVPLRDGRPDLPADFVRTVERALATDPADRFASAGEMERALAIGAAAAPTPAARAASRRWLLPAVGLAAVLLVAVLLPRLLPAPGALELSATLYRADEAGDTPLRSGDAVRVGDQLWLELQTAEAAYVYVLDEDEAGALFVLFPVDGLALRNPLPPGKHRLPGELDGVSRDWEITSAGGRETILVVSSREALPPIEREIASLPAASAGPRLAYALLEPGTLDDLRGVAGLRPSHEREPPPGGRLAGLARSFREAGADTRDLWFREIRLRGD